MNLLEILASMGGTVGGIAGFLDRAAGVPELADEANRLKAELSIVPTPETLARLNVLVPQELAKALKFEFDPHQPPGGFA